MKQTEFTEKISMVDLIAQHNKIQDELDSTLLKVSHEAQYINGPEVKLFAEELTTFLGGNVYTIPCANGTDALQIALMALDLKPGDEIITATFTYVATAEVIALLGLVPILVDVYPDTFSLNLEEVEKAITPKTKAIVPVHLFGQAANMEELIHIANKYKLKLIEDTAQALGAKYFFSDGRSEFLGTIGDVGCTSFFPSKNLGCMGDGGAIFTRDKFLAGKIQMIANHGQSIKYQHDILGCNSRLDNIQAAVLRVKLRYLNDYGIARMKAADIYDMGLQKLVNSLITPIRFKSSTHVFNQYTVQVQNGRRDDLIVYLKKLGIPTMVYYPIPLHRQKAFKIFSLENKDFPVSEYLCTSVLSLPMHPELTNKQQDYIINSIIKFYE